ncbi:MAG TPA: glutamine--fructose-6-phosphate transaminase (isomerizing) [bacterium]|jgi:glucosamine--fructose-6-phosphate aminotransferase (isomerizing)|nr:glutamine--fructose-6-phosphate transaminase (isomerizing) [bacterium]HOF79927.1 glutamine--fructose-6-phosphate transaminase (isomerizing) [bacterium]HOH85214.1 glutamine--fructose-6-phosphate transaminase (isomerizing) [bacterium]HOQ91346.1 glutamine--fructose-6-phosphate transaminase (isomerizing) [bacterium]HPL22634.1 glutamine--fructose-6-phosphate transaminase (isomerizing) [bacterium]
MCGIIGYLGHQLAKDILLDGLKKLEYRGYDSAGLCILNDGQFFIDKKVGPVVQLEQSVANQEIISTTGIAHTRWATHGAPSENNAHPHFDCHGQIAVVHNGIIENYQALKEVLISEGHQFQSETDSEVLAHLIEKFYTDNLETAVTKALALVEGSYGLVVLSIKENKLVAVRQSSPLIIGVGVGETFVASDIPAILNYTKQVIYLNDNDLAIIDSQGYHLQNLAGQVVDRQVEEVKLNVEQIEKKGFKHFMLKEIFEQPQTISNVLAGRVKDGQIKLSIDLDLSRLKRIIIAACGTSWHSALIGKYLLENIARIPVEVDYASEFRYRQPLVSDTDLFVAISQSGETADTLAALREAKRQGAQTIAIVNVVGSTVTREVDSGIYLHAGPEIGVASTKAFTAQVTALILLALYLRQLVGQPLDDGLLADLNQLPEIVATTLSLNNQLADLAAQFYHTDHFLYLGRGLNFPVALEGALKLKEISYIHAEGYPAAEIKHGPIALVDENMPVVFLATKNDLSDKIISNIQEIKARGGRIIAVVDQDYDHIAELADHLIRVPVVNVLLSPIVNAIPLQLLAYHIADYKGLDVDKPRNLAKSVTVE